MRWTLTIRRNWANITSCGANCILVHRFKCIPLKYAFCVRFLLLIFMVPEFRRQNLIKRSFSYNIMIFFKAKLFLSFLKRIIIKIKPTSFHVILILFLKLFHFLEFIPLRWVFVLYLSLLFERLNLRLKPVVDFIEWILLGRLFGICLYFLLGKN